jgi:enterochelin esterase-like enzyme
MFGPMRRALIAIALFSIAARSPSAQTLPPLKGSVERVKVHGVSLEGNLEGDSPDRDVSVYLPPSYRTDPQRRYPVVYVLHGFTDSENGWFRVPSHFVNLPASMEKAIADGTRDMILVTPDAFTRYGGSMYGSSITTGDWETFVTRELVSYIDAHYRTIAQRASRGLAGHSMGGYGTFRLAMKHPGVYGAVYALSACCLVPTYAQPAAIAKAETIQSDSAFAKTDFLTKVMIGMAASWSPNPKAPPYFEFPYKGGTLQPEVMAEWSANSPIAMLNQYVANLKQIPFIAFDVGLQDQLLAENQHLDRLLSDYSIRHTFETYEGTHTSKIGERLELKALPFFSKVLSFGTMAPGDR